MSETRLINNTDMPAWLIWTFVGEIGESRKGTRFQNKCRKKVNSVREVEVIYRQHETYELIIVTDVRRINDE